MGEKNFGCVLAIVMVAMPFACVVFGVAANDPAALFAGGIVVPATLFLVWFLGLMSPTQYERRNSKPLPPENMWNKHIHEDEKKRIAHLKWRKRFNEGKERDDNGS